MRAALRRWLGVPDRAEVEAIVLGEIDRDQAWKTGPHRHGILNERRAIEGERRRAIQAGNREKSGA